MGGFRYGDLFEPERLAALDAAFRADLNGLDAALAQRFESYRAGAPLSPPEESELLIAVARVLARFVARLFDIGQVHQALLDRAMHEAAKAGTPATYHLCREGGRAGWEQGRGLERAGPQPPVPARRCCRGTGVALDRARSFAQMRVAAQTVS